jgi:tetratricopeptide (TPR) repeat protein
VGRAVLLALCLVLAAPLHAAAEWKYASSAHFEIFTTAGDRAARDTLAQFERIRAFFAHHLQLTPPAGRLVRLMLFSDEREFRPYRINDAVVAYYRPGPDRDYIVMRPLGRSSHAVMVHEYVHLILTRAGSRYPLWLDEGLAEYFATMPASGSAVPVGRMSRARLRGLESARMVSLDGLFGVTHESPEYQTAEHGGLFYAQSWALTHMLLADDRYRDGASRFLAMVRAGTPSAQAIETVWGRPLRQVERDLAEYVSGGHFPVRVVRFEEPAPTVPVTTRGVSPFEAGLVTANLLAAAREDADKARAAFEALAASHPDDIQLLESRAALEFRTGRPRAARGFLTRAVELRTTTAASYRDLAALVVAEDAPAAEALLEQAIALDPTDVRARVHLATLASRRSPVEVLSVLEPISRVSAADAFDVLRLRVSAYLAIDDVDRAREAARDLVQVALSRQQRTVAARLLAEVEQRLAARDVADPEVTPLKEEGR